MAKTSSAMKRSSAMSAGGNAELQTSRDIYNSMLQQGLNSSISGIRKKAEEGKGNYSFKVASAVPYNEAETMISSSMKAITRGENTLIDGILPNGKHVYFAGKTNSRQIQLLLEKRKSKTDTTANIPDNKTTTTTYDSWRRRNRKNFESWFFSE